MARYALVAWTLFTWGTRIRNAAADGEGVAAYVVPVVLCALAVVAVVRAEPWTRTLAMAASLAWIIRVPVILVQDFGVGFKVVHTALAVVTWMLAWWATAPDRARRPATASGTARHRRP